MPLFPDRDKQLVPASSRELALVSPGLTAEQKIQLTTVTTTYLREHHLIGFQNTKAVLPVIRACVLAGLQNQHQRQAVLPTDDLTQAFKAGYQERKRLLKTMEAELEGLSGETRFEGSLALPQNLVQSALKEANDKVFLPKLSAGEKIAEITGIRRPIFRQLVAWSRDKIEEDIPGSKQVALTPQQEAGLVRHLVFGWAVFKEPRLLLETEDFMTLKSIYLAHFIHGGVNLWQELAKITEQNSPEATTYLQDMASQVADLLGKVPDKPASGADNVTVASTINAGFKALSEHFLVINPFDRFPSLSENRQDRGKSIWDENKSFTITINNVVHRLPRVSTLSLAAYLISGKDPSRAQQYRWGASRVSGLTAEIARQQSDKTIPDLKNQIEADQQALQRLREAFIKKESPQEITMARAEANELAESQLAVMLDELQFIPTVRSYHDQLMNLGLRLIRQYQNGKPLQSDSDLTDLLTVHYSPGILTEHSLYFMRERVTGRTRAFEDLLAYGNFAEAMLSQASGDYPQTKFSQTLGITVLDVLACRNNYWLDQFLHQRPDLSPEELQITWKAILIQAERTVRETAWHEAVRRIPLSHEERQEVYNSILADKTGLLGKEYSHIKYLARRLAAGTIPNDETLYQAYLKQWRKKEEQIINSAINKWTNEKRITLSLRDNLETERGVKLPRYGTESITETAQEPWGPLRIALHALSKNCPAQLLPDYPIGIEQIAHGVHWENPHDPYAYIRPGNEGKKQLQQKRLAVYNRFQEWLKAQGIDLGETLHNLLKPFTMSELINSGRIYHQLFAVEGELRYRYSEQIKRLSIQTSEPVKFYHTSPTAIVNKYEFRIAATQRSLDSITRINADRADSHIKALKQLGLIQTDE